MNPPLNRRTFLFGALAAGAVAGIRPVQAKDEKLRIAQIGCGGQGEYSWRSLTSEEMVVLCDVDLARTARAKEVYPNAEVVQDFRRVIERKDIDAVVVATPDHWHAIPAVWAMETGKHVYCEKPLARTVWEVRQIREAAKKHKRVTQMGTQIHAGANYRRVVELVQAGAIGKVERVDVWCEKQPSPGKLSSTGTAPATLDYELWVGPAAYRPFDPNIVPFNWRWWWEFGGGVLADMGCHYMDLAHWALDLRQPERVKAAGTKFADADNTVPVELRADYFYAGHGDQSPVRLTWWHGTSGPRNEAGEVVRTGMSSGVLFHGTEGELLADYSRHKLLPEEKFRDYKRPDPTIADSIGHHKEWVNAIKNGGPTTCNFDYSGNLSETVLLGNVAYRLGQEIEWNSKKLKVSNSKDAEALIRPEYRGDWKIHHG